MYGLARSGISAVRALRAGDADVFAWDDKEPLREAARAAGASAISSAEWPWDRLAAVILSPGVPLTHPKPHEVVQRAKDRGIEVIGDIELFARENLPAPVIAITGTNGKSTTTALIGHILRNAGFDAQVGGNIGNAALELSPPGARTAFVLEMSSYQIDLSPGFRPDVAVLSNITPDHIDRHGTLENYAAVKMRLLKQTRKEGLNVVGVDDSHCAAIFTRLTSNGGAPCVAVSVGKVLGRGIFVLDGVLYDAQHDHAAKITDLRQAAHLPG
ncbi:MAG TPA: Mur ligase family protein, partial [Rhizomicrobium sp.]|nr:Mur ligase family protein [Rhizomicrobium sp.]